MKTITLLFIIPLFINSVFGDEVKSVSVMEGDSLTLQTDVPDIQTDNDLTLTWTFGASIAHINREAKTAYTHPDVLDGRFRDRLHLNEQTGDLTITNINTEDSGLYQVDITVGNKPIKRSFNVNSVSNPESDQLKSVSVKNADSVTLHTDVPDIKTYDVIQWRFKGSRIAHFNKSTSEISDDDNIHDQRFRDKLQLDVKTGSLQIKNIGTDLSGFYEVEISSTSSSYTIHQTFTVTVSDGEVKSVSVMKGDPVTIYTDVPDIKTYDQILLIFGCDDRIAAASKQNKQFTLYWRIRDRLTLNDQTGDLTITDIRTEDAGDYELKMSSSRRTIQRRFSVNVSEQRGLSPGPIAGISVILILLAAAAAAAVIYYRHKMAEAMKQLGETKILEVNEGKSVNLKTEVKDIKRVDLIEWRFEETLIAKINPANKIFNTYDYGTFRGKLELNHQTGDLTISDIRREHSGVYKLKIIRDGETSDRILIVSVRHETLEVYEGESVDLKTKVTDIKKDDVIEWTFEETLIAKINPANNIFRTYDGDKGRFRDKLTLDHQTGDLNIKDIRQMDNGDYTLKIIRDGKTSYKTISVFVRYKILHVDEGKSADLKADLKDIWTDDVIEWRFNEILIAQINHANKIFRTYDDDYDLFRGKLKLNHQTGDLNINDITWDHTGEYILKIIRGRKISDKIFGVRVRFVILEVDEGKYVNLETEGTDIQRDEKIEWRFRETLIAEINPANNIFKTYDGDDDLFRDKLTLDHQTGYLNIKDIRREHTGDYTLKIIKDGKTSELGFRVCFKGEDSGRKRGEDSVAIEMQPLLNKRSQ